ncbi:MAG: ABC transporter permease [Actinobacteria bacterium ATB1]|nr:ABC transporter permease [Actinobacteria bacterium ATB1]
MSAITAQARMEFLLTLRRGESLVVTLAIPLGLLVFMPRVLGESGSIDEITPGILALSVVATSMVSFAISTGYDRAYGVLKLIGGSPLGRPRLIVAKVLAILVIQAFQLALVVLIALLLGWAPAPVGIPQAILILAVGSAAFTGLGLLLAGTLRAEGTLAVSNLLFLVFVPMGGVIVPPDELPGVAEGMSWLLPITPFVESLRIAFEGGWAIASVPFALLCGWGAVLCFLAARNFRWE